MAEWELIAFLQLRGSVVVSLGCSGEVGVWPQRTGSMDALGRQWLWRELWLLQLFAGRFWGRRRPALHGRGSGTAAVSLLQLLLLGKGRPCARSRGRAVAADMLPFLPQKDAESLLQRLLLLLNFPVFPTLPQ